MTTMKYFNKYALCACFCAGAMTLLSSCEDFLDRQEDEQMTFEKIWHNRNDVKRYWLNAMSFLPNDGNNVGEDPYIGSADECIIAWDRAYRKINYGTWNASNIPYDRFGNMYRGIRECNIFMQNVYHCDDPLITKDQLDEWYWQARFARAYYYFLLMENYGPVFLMGDEITDATLSTEALYRPRNTWEQCVNYVISELTTCANSNSIQTQSALKETTTKWGLATKGVCHAVMSRLLLYSARDLFNGNATYRNMKNPVTPDFPDSISGVNLFPTTYDANKWLLAAKEAKAVMDDGSYQLYRAGNNNPYEDYYGVTNKDWNSELIWTDRYNSRQSWGQSCMPTIAGSAYGAIAPTQKLVDAFAMNNGVYPIVGYEKDGTPQVDKASGYNRDTELKLTEWDYPRKGWTKQSTTEKVTAPNMYKDREPRFYITVFFSGIKWYHGSASTMISFAKNGNANKTHDYSKSGYLVNRFYDHMLNAAASDGWGHITYPLFRLGETYLNFIESVLECKKRGVAMPGDYEKLAMDVWADLRDRAGMKPITDIYPNASTEELIELCRRERQVELTFEGLRYFDTRTWKIAEQTDNGPVYGMDVNVTTKDPQTTPEAFWKRTIIEKRVFKSNHYLYPFSQRELDRNKLLTQNYGW
jgi:hypothetical protein